MFFRQIHKFFSFRRILLLLLGLAIGVQLILITYNHWSGYHVLNGISEFLTRLAMGSLLSLFAGFLIIYPDLYIIRYLNQILPWGKKLPLRLVLELGFSILVAITISSLFTLLSNTIGAYEEDFRGVMIYNAMIFAVVNLIIVSILEGWIFFIESKQAKQQADILQDELSQIKFEVLKSQINPHFMFNSLNVLSGLIGRDDAKAQQFIDEFSQIYRYVLETIEQPVATVGKELDFARSYLFLQQIRYGKNLIFSINIPSGLLKLLLPPLSLQVVLENATKHNIVNESKPLHIDILNDDLCLVIKNNIQPKISVGRSTGLGLKNLVKRYALISDLEPSFKLETNHYVVRLPLIKTEDDERTDH